MNGKGMLLREFELKFPSRRSIWSMVHAFFEPWNIPFSCLISLDWSHSTTVFIYFFICDPKWDLDGWKYWHSFLNTLERLREMKSITVPFIPQDPCPFPSRTPVPRTCLKDASPCLSRTPLPVPQGCLSVPVLRTPLPLPQGCLSLSFSRKLPVMPPVNLSLFNKPTTHVQSWCLASHWLISWN